MKKSNIEKKESHFFWNGRAGFGQAAGSRDLIAKELEIEAISKYIFDGMRVLDAGCGNGITAIEIAKKYNVNIVGFDFSEEMIKAAKALSSSTKLKGTIDYHVIDIT